MPQPIPIDRTRTAAPAILSTVSDEALRFECARRRLIACADAPTGDQIRGARGLLDWPMHRLARAAGVSESTIKRIEDGDGKPQARKLAAISDALQRAGVRFFVRFGEPAIARAPRILSRQAAA